MEPSCKPEKETLYRVGMFSQMNQVTIKALRHYDDKGLLKPRYVDPENGYRYYSASQLPILHQIIALRDIGFSLDEIQKVQQGTEKEKLLKRKKARLLEEIAQRMQEVSLIEAYLSGEELVEYDIIEKSLPEVIVASYETTIKNHGELMQAMPRMGREMERLGCECALPEYCFNVYLDGEYKEEDIRVDICEAVVAARTGDSFITFKTLPPIEKAICAIHKGPYETLPMMYQSLLSFIEQNDYEITDLPRESYIDGIWNRDTDAEWLTEIQIPVQAKN